jgi:hypothetical protein
MEKLNINLRAGILSLAFSLFGLMAYSQIAVVHNVSAGSWPTEVGWEIVNTSTGVVVGCQTPGSGTGTFNLNIPAGTYNIQAYDSFGDGWNGSQSTVLQSGVQIGGPFTLASGGFSNSCPGNSFGPVIGTFQVALGCTLNCPADITVSPDPGGCEATVFYEAT